MTGRTRIALTAGLLAAACATAVASAAVSPVPDHVVWADTLVDHILPQNNEYAGTPTSVHWAGVDGAVAYDNRSQCSSFLTTLLKRVYGWTNSDFSEWFGATSPTASVYHHAIEAQNGFALITDVRDIQPGDILAVEYLEADATVTGHVMMADDIARARTSTAPLVSGTVQYTLTVIDSSSSGHGSKTDTRMMSDGTWDTGVGRGMLRLYVDLNKVVVGYSWSTDKASIYYGPQLLRHLQIGRLAIQ